MAVVAADHVLWPEICAVTDIVYVPAYPSTFVAPNVTIFPDNVISEVPAPPVTVMA